MQLLYLVFVVCLVIVLFIFLRRPMYEVMTVAMLAVVIISGNLSNLGGYLYSAATNFILYTIIGFTAFSAILNHTGVVDGFINVIIALIGRFSGGAGYVALAASSLFGALSGTGPGNTAAVGTITIPVMKKTGFSPELAATTEMAASALGPVIPPSGTVATAFSILAALYPEKCTFSQFWVCMWGISLWFILQRFILLYILIKRYHIGPIPKEDRLPVKVALKDGWKATLMPVIILAPFIFDSLCNSTFVAGRLGSAGASAFTTALLGIVPSIAILYVLAISGKKYSLRSFTELIGSAIHAVCPVVMMVFSGLAMGLCFGDLGIGDAAIAIASNMQLQKWHIIIFLPLFFAFLGMFLETQSILLMLGSFAITLGALVGINPMLMASLLPCMSQAMGHMTPPFALTFFVAIGIAESDFVKSAKMAVLWCVGHYIFIVLAMAGLLPILGLIP